MSLEVSIPVSSVMDSSDERRLFHAREVSKSASVAVSCVLFYAHQLETSSKLSRDKIDLLLSAVRVHGRYYPEIFFFGIDVVRRGVDVSEGSLVESGVQFCVTAIGLFRAYAKNNSENTNLLVIESAVLLSELLVKLDCSSVREDANKVSNESIAALSECVSRELLQTLSATAGGFLLSAMALLETVLGMAEQKASLVRVDVGAFCVEYIVRSGGSVADDGSTDALFVGAVEYLSAALKSPSVKPKVRKEIIDCVFKDCVKLSNACVASSVSLLNHRQSLFAVCTFSSLVIHSGVRLNKEAAATGEEEATADVWTSWAANMYGDTSSGDKNIIVEKLTLLATSLAIDDLDDVFSAYTAEGAVDARDAHIIVALLGIAAGLCSLLSALSSVRKSDVLLLLRKWIVTSVSSGDAFVVGGGLGLAKIFFASTKEPMNTLISKQAFGQAIETMEKRSVRFAAEQAVAFLGSVPGSCSEFGKLFFDKFFFHSQVILCEELKVMFFKTFSMKEIFLRVLSVVHEIADGEEQAEVVQVLGQMVTAMKTKGLMEQVRKEIVAIELDRAEDGSDNAKAVGGFMVWVMTAINAACARDDLGSVETLAYIFLETFLAQISDKQIVSGLLLAVPVEFRSNVATVWQSGSTYRPRVSPDKENRAIKKPKSVLDVFVEKNMVPSSVVPKKEEKPMEQPPTEEPLAGWADAAADWFLSYAEGPQQEDLQQRLKDEKERKKKAVAEETSVGSESKPVTLTKAVEVPVSAVPPIQVSKAPEFIGPKVLPGVKPSGGVPPGAKPSAAALMKQAANPSVKKVASMAPKTFQVSQAPNAFQVPQAPKTFQFPQAPKAPQTPQGPISLPTSKVVTKSMTKVVAAKPAVPMLKSAVPPVKSALPGKSSVTVVKPPVTAPPAPVTDPEEPAPKDQPPPAPQGWGEYIGGLWAAEPPKEKKKKKKKQTPEEQAE